MRKNDAERDGSKQNAKEAARRKAERQGREYDGGPPGHQPDERNSTEQQYGQQDKFDPKRK